ncbi:MAG: DNA-directed RNA polymerase subunit beta' [Bacteroidales bacterium OttesenSCG-928-I14]|jgi:DNA-directed RNA polymerase subunit beta'|nr:DNA-directed RNA polymerase subunit beta' [Bacteroidales bacterium OttesenSCG-928-I14]
MTFKRESSKTKNFSKILINLASSDDILSQSSGEVLKPETINYRTYKPERDGLFCERIFGPVKDYECHCGKYKRIRYRGVVCDRCGVEVIERKVRRERMGHIQLVVPVVHIWYFRSLPNKIGYLLGLSSKKIDTIIYYERFVVIQPGITNKEVYDLLSEEEYLEILESLPIGNNQLDDVDPNKFIAKMGGDAIYDLLTRLDLDALSNELRHKAYNDTSQQRKNDALKRLQVVESFRISKNRNRPEWMVIKVVPVIPPELRPLVPLDGGRFASSDVNDLYRRVIIRNNRLKRLIGIKAPDIILRNEKRMLQEAVDSLFDNSRKSSAVKTDSNRPLKSLSDNLKGKQGRFRQNLLGKRVDYSARSVIVVGPELKMHECGLPKNIAAELYKPFIIRKLIERGVAKTVKSAKKIVDKKDSVIWDILEYVMKGHPVLLNRAPTLHRLSIQAFQPKLIEGKAIQLHPLSCTAFNADFDGDQMAVHLPLGNEAILEAQILMLASHNILNPANGAPITIPSQDMVLGLFYITKIRGGAKGEGLKFYGIEEAIIAYNEKKVDIHALVKVCVDDIDEKGNFINHMVETSVGRVIVNEFVPKAIGFVNEELSKKSLKNIIGDVIKICGISRTAQFLDDIKNLGYTMAFKGGLSFNLDNIIIPKEKDVFIQEGYKEVEEILSNYSMGIITYNERYNQIIDTWTHVNSRLSDVLIKQLQDDDQGFNPVFMMLESGARGSKEQIRQLSSMRGLMAKPQKRGTEGGQIIENPILSNFKEGLSVLEYFISTHGARKGLADTALKTADAGYLTRRLVDASHNVIVNEEDCGTLRGLVVTKLKKNEDLVASLYDRILGRVSVSDIKHPITGEILVHAGNEIVEKQALDIQNSSIECIEIRSVLTCESKKGVCSKCYGRNLSTGKMVQLGEAVGIIAAQSIGEPGTQLTLRTFHVGGIASNIAIENNVISKYNGALAIDDLRVVQVDEKKNNCFIVVSRLAEMRIIDDCTKAVLATYNIPYAAKLFFNDGDTVKKGDLLFEWDAFNSSIISEDSGKFHLENVIENITYKKEYDEQTGLKEMVIIESRDKTKIPIAHVLNENEEINKTYNLPLGARIVKKEGDLVKIGDVLVKIPRLAAKTGDITGGLPRVTELFEARNPSNPAIVSEIDGEVSFGKIKRGSREIIVTSTKTRDSKAYFIPLSKQILVQENDYIRAGMALSDGIVTPADILAINGATAVQEYIVNEIQDVYRLQGVKINDKHFEVIVRQMLRKVEIIDPGDTKFVAKQLVDKDDIDNENNCIWNMKIVVDAGDASNIKLGELITVRKFREENSVLKRRNLKLIKVRDSMPATVTQILQGLTRAALQTSSFISAASFQETTKVLNEAAIRGKVDMLVGMKENVICGHLVPTGTGLKKYDRIVVDVVEQNKLTK